MTYKVVFAGEALKLFQDFHHGDVLMALNYIL